MFLEGMSLFMKAAILYDSQTGHTATAATYVAEGIKDDTNIEVQTFHIDKIDTDYIQSADLIIFGSPTYMASTTGKMKLWLEQNGGKLNLAGKLGGAFATEQYIHGGAENALQILLTHELVLGMMTYSGGVAFGKPVIHLGPVGMRQNMESFQELFHTYGQRMAVQLQKIHSNSNN